MASSATAKKPAIDIGMVFGMPKKGDSDTADEGGDARDTLKQASGWDDDTLDALHDYVNECMGPKSSKSTAEMDDSGDDESAEG